jgi:tetratricopeptide (TPR) repeat protein
MLPSVFRRCLALSLVLACGSAALARPRRNPETETVRNLIRIGQYGEAERRLRGQIGRGQRTALLGLARVQLETGRVSAAAATARRARSGRLAARALTLEGEAQLALGNASRAAELLTQATDKAPGRHRAWLFLGLAFRARGRLAEANAIWERFYDEYDAGRIDEDSASQLTYVAIACRHSGNYQDAADLLRQATETDPRQLEAWVQWGEISFEKYDAKNADKQFRQALRINPRYIPALLGLARIALDERFDVLEANRRLERARHVAPPHGDIEVIRARALIVEHRYSEAIDILRKLLERYPRHLEGNATIAAAYFLADDTAAFRRTRATTLALNPRYSEFFRICARLAAQQRRYQSAAALAKQAIAVNPDDAYAHNERGINLLRLGQEREGIAALKRAWAGDPYNARTYRLLDLYEKVLPRQYEFSDHGIFRLRTHKSETALLERVVLPELQRAYRYYTRRYRFQPRGPIVVELYRKHEHYAVRTVGVPRLAVLGVCFGRVITSVSPTQGKFNWAQVLWHELNHVFTIQLSRSRVPRWLTEGVADFEPATVRAEWKREGDYALYRALRSGTLEPLGTITQAFTRAPDLQAMTLGYYQSQLLTAALVSKWGVGALTRTLRAYAEGQTTAQVWRRVTGLSLDKLDAEFRSEQRKRLAPYARGWTPLPSRYRNLEALERAASTAGATSEQVAGLAFGQLLRGKGRDALRTALRALESNRRERLALFVLARVAERFGHPAEATRRFNELIAVGGDGFEPRLAMGRLALVRGAIDVAHKQFQRAKRFNPQAAAPHALLAQAYQRSKRRDAEIEQLKALVALEQQRARPALRLVRLLAQRRDYAALRHYGQLAYHIQPGLSWLHERMARAFEAPAPRPMLERAIWHLETALLCSPRDPATIHRALARLLPNVGRRRQAELHRRLSRGLTAH